MLGNGDINALLYGGATGLKLRLTKNDVWDARIDTSGDPALGVIDIPAHTIAGGTGSPASWNKPYPCPLTCAVLDLGSAAGGQVWQNIRAEGTVNTWTYAVNVATMAIQGGAGQSCGWQAPITTGRTYSSVRVRLSGTANARHYIEVLRSGGGSYGSGWQNTPATVQDYVFTLPAATGVSGILLYAWTTDGVLAQNRYTVVELRGSGGNDMMDLTRVSPVPAANRIDLRRAVATVPGISSASVVAVRALADRNVFLIEGDTSVTLNPTTATFVPAATRGTQGGVEYLVQNLPADPGYPTAGDWPGMSFAVAKAVQGQRTAVAIVTSLESATPQADAIALASAALATDAVTLHQLHEARWEQFWSACRVDLGDTYLRDVWYRNLYAMRCVSKAGVKPAGLFAGLVGDSAEWHGDYHLTAIKQVAIFYADFADKCATNATTGRIVFGPTYSPEHWNWGRDDGTCDIAFARMTLKAAIEGATKLGMDAALVTRWQQTLAKIPDYPRTTGSSPVILDVAGAAPTTYNVPVPALPVYPAGEINWFSPAAERQIFANTIGGLSSNGNNDMIILAGARARLSMADAYTWMRAQFQARQRANGLLKIAPGNAAFNGYGHYTEDFAATAVINELLLQSVGGILRLFPAWPANQEAAFENLRAQGGFLVSAGFKDGTTTECGIRATAGGRLRFLNPWPDPPFARRNGVVTTLTNEGGGVFGLDTAVGDAINLTASGTPFSAWQDLRFGSQADPNAGPAADPDADGLDNAVEFVLDSEPNPANPGAGSAALAPLSTTAPDGTLTFAYRRSDVALTQPGIAIRTQYGSDLSGWTDAIPGIGGISTAVVDDGYGPGLDRVSVILPGTLAAAGRLFARLRVVLPLGS